MDLRMVSVVLSMALVGMDTAREFQLLHVEQVVIDIIMVLEVDTSLLLYDSDVIAKVFPVLKLFFSKILIEEPRSGFFFNDYASE